MLLHWFPPLQSSPGGGTKAVTPATINSKATVGGTLVKQTAKVVTRALMQIGGPLTIHPEIPFVSSARVTTTVSTATRYRPIGSVPGLVVPFTPPGVPAAQAGSPFFSNAVVQVLFATAPKLPIVPARINSRASFTVSTVEAPQILIFTPLDPSALVFVAVD